MTEPDAGPPDSLTFRYCGECGQWLIAGRSFCAVHPDRALARRRLSGRGTVFSYTVSHVALSPSVADKVPYTTVLVATDEGPRILAHVDGAARPRIGDPVELVEADESLSALQPGCGRRIAHIATQKEVPA